MIDFFICLLLTAIPAGAAASADGEIHYEKLKAERLPDLTIARCGHSTFWLDGKLTVFGGHTTGFIPTATAEYYEDGSWHELRMLYPHDLGFSVRLRSGEVVLGGGCESNFGIGQSWPVEKYDPRSRRFYPMPILDRKRALCSAVELEDRSIVVSGNWYAEDGSGRLFPEGIFEETQDVAEPRAFPLIFPVSNSQVIVFGAVDNYGKLLDGMVDCIPGTPFEVPLLKEWHPCTAEGAANQDGFFIGDTSSGDYSYLVPASTDDGRTGIILIKGMEFSLLELERPVPGLYEGTRIDYGYGMFSDRQSRRCWVVGIDREYRCHIVEIGYGDALDGGKASVRLNVSEPLEGAGAGPIIRAQDGRFVLAGGARAPGYNYEPSAAVYIISLGGPSASGFISFLKKASTGSWGFILLLVAAGVVCSFIINLRKKHQDAAEPERQDILLAKICDLMEKEQLFKQQGLTLSDLAQRMGSNTRYVSECINSGSGVSFTDFINGFRVRYAQNLMKVNPKMTLSEISEESGFSSESTFYRNFKALTGKTPAQWISDL